jgi:FKBP-type peptidyl-prolyl cis-trans isomerase
MRTPTLRLLLCWLGLLVAPAFLHAQREKLSPDDLDFVEKTWPTAKKTNTGIRYLIEREGQGAPPRPGDNVSVLYSGRLLSGKVFDQNFDAKHPFTFRLGRGVVIQGWDQVLQLMRPGEKRLVIVPSELAYGTRGQGPQIPRDATLVFEIDLLAVDREN